MPSSNITPSLVQSDGGNATARYLGMEKAPVTLEDAATALTSLVSLMQLVVNARADIVQVDKSTREMTSGKFFGTISGEEIPW